MKALIAQARMELVLSLRQGEQLLVAMGIPVLLLVFLTQVALLPAGSGARIDTLTPAVLALAVMSSAMVSLGIGTGFERHYGVLKRLGATPLGRPRLLGAKVAALLVTETVQLLVLSLVALVLGWDPTIDAAGGALALAALVVATAAFAGLGLALAGTLSGPANLAAANGLYLLLLLFGGVAVPAEELPGPLQNLAELTPIGALVKALRAATDPARTGTSTITASLVVLLAWAAVTVAVAARTFRWSPNR
ncbi:MAG: ABC transporter permease [Acidimicrobiales bacterium]